MQARQDPITGRHWPGFLVLLLLTGCASGQEATRPSAPAPAAASAHAERLEASGDLPGAAQEYSTLALDAAPPRHQDLQLRAIDALVRSGATAQAKALLDKVQTDGLEAAYEQRKRLLGARIALAEQQPYAALDLVPAVPTTIPRALQAALCNVRAQAYALAGNALDQARERCRLDTLLTDPEELHANHHALWAALRTMSPTALEQLRTAPPPDLLSGWMELAGIAATTSDTAQRSTPITAWQQRYPKHPANTDVIPSLLGTPVRTDQPTAGGGYPPRLAVLLPLTGQFAPEALALRNGLLAAYYRHRWGGTRPQLRFYDTGMTDNGMRQFYDQAVADGAGLVIGPLTKAAVADLARGGPLSIPVLALNQLDGVAPAHFYQFALAPEDEARQTAERASLDGHTQALAIVPTGDWGAHLLEAFKQRFEELGGSVTAVEHYGANSDFPTLVRHLLGRDPAAPISHDADMLFMVALPAPARQILAQLHAQQTGAPAVYATSHLYSLRAADLDGAAMENLIFCDMPWMLSSRSLSSPEHTAMARLWPDSLQAYPRLYALGIDAYNIIPYLDHLGTTAITGYPGESGQLYLDGAQRLHRQLLWARYSGNTPLLIDAAPLNFAPTAH